MLIYHRIDLEQVYPGGGISLTRKCIRDFLDHLDFYFGFLVDFLVKNLIFAASVRDFLGVPRNHRWYAVSMRKASSVASRSEHEQDHSRERTNIFNAFHLSLNSLS